MPKISINIDNQTIKWLEQQQKETGSSRTEVLQAILRAFMIGDSGANSPVESTTKHTEEVATMPVNMDVSSIALTLDALFQRYLIDHPVKDRSPDERWETFKERRKKLLNGEMTNC